MLSRRDLLASIAVGAGLHPAVAHCHPRRWGLQLYTVRELLSANFEGTLRNIAQLGYGEVEFAGILGSNIKRTRDLLRFLNLQAPSLHVEYTALQSSPETAFETANRLGADFVVCPWLDASMRRSADDWKLICDTLNSIGELAHRSNLTFAYHNHDFEFSDLISGFRAFDLLLGRTDERFVKFELDVYWATKGGVDPASYLKAHPSRFCLIHLKDMARDGSITEVGNGTIDFGRVISASLTGNVSHFFVEQDFSSNPIRSIERSISYLRRHRLSRGRH